MAIYSDDRLRRLYKESVTSPHDQAGINEWVEVVKAVEQLEEDNPDLRDHEFMAEKLTENFCLAAWQAGQSGTI